MGAGGDAFALWMIVMRQFGVIWNPKARGQVGLVMAIFIMMDARSKWSHRRRHLSGID